MKRRASRSLFIPVAFLAVSAALLILFVNRSLADLADWAWPGSAVWVHLGLMAVEALALLRFWLGLFGGRKHLLLMAEPTPAAERAFAEELARRMRDNPLVPQNAEGIPDVSDPARLNWCMAYLNRQADAEIRRNARRVFLATALSQNGRLDALIVFVTLCRMVWRIAALYNQRPHPREIMSLYRAVATSTFLALSLEELDIATEIGVGFGEAFHAMAPAGLTSSIPFAGRALHVVTKGAIDGAANCYLCLRAGIITRNAYAYRARQEKIPARAAVFKEAGAILLDMSATLIENLARSLAGALTKGTVRVGRDIAGGITHGVTASAGMLASGAVSAVQSTGNGISKAAGLIASPFRHKPAADDEPGPPQEEIMAALEKLLRENPDLLSGRKAGGAAGRVDAAYAELLAVVDGYLRGDSE
jgi:hypothetical protein